MDKRNPWSLAYLRNVTSQFGEDGVLERIFELLGYENRWCVEFGAADGRWFSNTCQLIETKDFSGVLIEADPARFEQLRKSSAANSKLTVVNRFVGFGADDNLDVILKQTRAPRDLDLLSIDIDGNDYHVWSAIEHYRPRVVVIEYNPTIPNAVEFVQEADMGVSQGSSLLSLTKLARRKGYELAAATFANGVFVEASLLPKLGIEDNSIHALRADESAVTYLFGGYDGTIFIRGSASMHWHGLPLKEDRFQVLPRLLRCYPERYTLIQRVLKKIYSVLYRRGII